MNMNDRFYFSYDIKISLKSHFGIKMLRFGHDVHMLLWTSLRNATK